MPCLTLYVLRKVYLIEGGTNLSEKKPETSHYGKGRTKRVSLADFAFRTFEDLGLAKPIHKIDEGSVELTAAQHKARGVLYVTEVS